MTRYLLAISLYCVAFSAPFYTASRIVAREWPLSMMPLAFVAMIVLGIAGWITWRFAE